MGFTGFAGVAPLQLQATTNPSGVAGAALINGTQTIISWTAPNDGNMHRAHIFCSMDVTSGLTGGQINSTWIAPDGTVGHPNFFAANSAAGTRTTSLDLLVQPGSVVNVVQSSAVTAGAAVLWAEIWGS